LQSFLHVFLSAGSRGQPMSLWKKVQNTFGGVLKTDTLQLAENLIRGVNALICEMGYPECRGSCETMETEEREDKNMSIDEKLIKIFEYALQQEETGKSFFQNSLQRMGWGSAVSAFKKLIAEEEAHILFIKKILSNLRQGGSVELPHEKGLSLEPTNYFDERAKSEFLQQCLEGSMVPEVTIFSTAWLIEKDLSEFYEKMANQTEGKAKEALQMLSNWEKVHEKLFREYRDRFDEMYSKMPWGG
jgi:rubrerythrin